MLLEDYLSKKTHGRIILIVSDLLRGQALIRMHEGKTRQMVRNVECMTISQMTDVLYKYIVAADGYAEEYELLDSTEAMMFFRGVLFKNIQRLSYFNNENMMDMITTQEIFRKANLVRTNGWSKEEEKVKNDRVSDLKLLISEYEDRLLTEKLMDLVAKEKYVLEKVKSFASVEDELRLVFPAEISYLAEDVETFNGVELALLDILKYSEDADVHAFSNGSSLDALSNCKGKASFYKGYGTFNEAGYVANDIFEKSYPLGDVTVLYSSVNQIPAIRAALLGNGIPMKVVSKYPVIDNAYIYLAKRILAWAGADYSEKALDDLLSSPVISVLADDGSGSKINVLTGQRYYDHVLNARNRRDDGYVLGWGYDRNVEFIEHERRLANDDSVKKVLKMHEALLGIFSDKGKPYDDKTMIRPITLYEKLVSFIEEYTIMGADYAVGIDSIRRLAGAVRFEERALPLDGVLRFINEILCTITVSDMEDTASVKVQAMDDWCFLDRPIVYMTGLSLKDMQGSTTESPVLFDDEMEKYLSTGYVPTIKNEADLKDRHLLYSLASFEGESIVFGYSDYETVNFRENNASAFFREALSVFGSVGIKDLPEFVYGNPSDPVDPIAIPAYKKKASYDVRLKTSSSSLEVLLDCPKKYAYDKLMHIPDNEFTECDYAHWLDAKTKGSFFHKIMEKYCNERLVKKVSETYDTAVDEGLVRTIAKQLEEELLLELPCAIRELADRETGDMIDEAMRYLQKLIDELNISGWRVVKAEQRFSEAAYPVTGLDGKIYDFEFSGSIDRIDYRIDKAKKKCYLRIIDYKTGKRENKKNEDDRGKLIQYAIYKKALMDTGKTEDKTAVKISLSDYIKDAVADLEEDALVRTFDYEFESFQYVFVLDKQTEEPIVKHDGELEGENLLRLRGILAMIENKHIYPDHKEMVDLLEEHIEDYYSKESDMELPDVTEDCPSEERDMKDLLDILTGDFESCKYCTYEYLCTHRKAGEIK